MPEPDRKPIMLRHALRREVHRRQPRRRRQLRAQLFAAASWTVWLCRCSSRCQQGHREPLLRLLRLRLALAWCLHLMYSTLCCPAALTPTALKTGVGWPGFCHAISLMMQAP